jgi:HAD superfamily hydrolase (TIGR01509 family)
LPSFDSSKVWPDSKPRPAAILLLAKICFGSNICYLEKLMIAGVAFDMDGTLTRPVIDFIGLREKIGVHDQSRPIFEQIMEMENSARARGLKILEEAEMLAAEKSEPNPGLETLVAFLEKRKIRKAIYTRNSMRSVNLTLGRLGLPGRFHPLVTRDHNLKLKPEPDMILHILESWRLRPEQALVVGDFEFDIIAGRAAGCRTVYVNHLPEKEPVSRLDELVKIIEALNGS